jgi:tRNA pseudouridine55 synthase
MDGLLVVDKPVGPTSHDVVARVRRALGFRRVGHTGTLDPGASGVLLVVIGRATRLARFLNGGDKTYEAVVRLGIQTDTHDAQGRQVGEAHRGPIPSRDRLDRALEAFRGTHLQQPPAYSAKKIAGRRSYEFARARRPENPARLPTPVTVTARSIEILGTDDTTATLRVTCSAGFYMRALAHGLGEQLGVGAHLVALKRIGSGDFTIADACDLEMIEREPEAARQRIIALAEMLPGLASVVLTPEGARRAGHGVDLGPSDLVKAHVTWRAVEAGGGPRVRLLDAAGGLVAIAEPAVTPGLLHPLVVLV